MRIRSVRQVSTICLHNVLAVSGLAMFSAAEAVAQPAQVRSALPLREATDTASFPSLALPAGEPQGTSILPRLSRRDWYTVGALGMGTLVFIPFDRDLTLALRSRERQESYSWRAVMFSADRIGAPGAQIAGPALLAAGLVFDNGTARDVGLHATQAYVLGTAFTFVVKGLAGRGRPYWPALDSPTDFRLGRGFPHREPFASFPSGHSMGTFALATVLTVEAADRVPEHARLVAVIAYGAAALDGVSRVYRDTHWPSDVAAAAAIGTLSGFLVTRRAHPKQSSTSEARQSADLGHLTMSPGISGELRVGWALSF